MSLPLPRTRAIVALSVALLTASLTAQCPYPYPPPPPPEGGGGSWGGPGDYTPPTTGGPTGPTAPSPTGPSPAGPSTPRPGTPSGPATGGTGGPTAPAARGPRTGGRPAAGAVARPAARPRTGPRGAPIGADLTTWQQWWDFNQDNFLRVRHQEGSSKTGSDAFYLGSTRKTVTPAAASRPLVVDKVLPALKKAVDVGPRNVTSAGMLALARIGIDHPDFKLFEVIARRLGDSDQRVRETAAVALGLVGHTDDRALTHLTSLVRDDEIARQAVGGQVQDRTRAFAAYGLGLLARRSESVVAKRTVFEALRDVLADDSIRSRDVRVAAIEGIGLLDIDQRQYQGMKLAIDVLATLDGFFREDRGVGEQQVQAHCPTAIARLLGRDHAQAERFKECFSAVLDGRALDGRGTKKRRYAHAVSQSCALALGQLVKPNDTGNSKDVGDARFSKQLLDTWRNHKDAQTRNFAMLALGQVGGIKNREVLLREFRRASSNIEQPWCAMALGLMCADKHAQTGEVDTLVVDTLRKKFKRSKNPQATGALAVGLGLSREDKVGGEVQERLRDAVGRDTMAAAMCDSLALLGAAGSREALHDVIRECDRRPRLLQKAAIALGRLGDPAIGDMLVRRLTEGEPNFVMQNAVANALIDVGGQQQIQPLLRVLADRSENAATRASAAMAIGGIVDARTLPWNTPLRANANYRATVATWTNRASGVLDLR